MVNSSTNINKTSNHLWLYIYCVVVGKGSQAPLAEHETDGMDQQQDESMKQTHDFGTISSKGTLNVLFKDKKLDITTM